MTVTHTPPSLPPLKNGIHDISDRIAVSPVADRMWQKMESDLLEKLKERGEADDSSSIVSIALEAADGALVLVAAEHDGIHRDEDEEDADYMLALLVVPPEHWTWLSEAASVFPPPETVQ